MGPEGLVVPLLVPVHKGTSVTISLHKHDKVQQQRAPLCFFKNKISVNYWQLTAKSTEKEISCEQHPVISFRNKNIGNLKCIIFFIVPYEVRYFKYNFS